jgi:two-component system CheB/CheR fusion protein
MSDEWACGKPKSMSIEPHTREAGRARPRPRRGAWQRRSLPDDFLVVGIGASAGGLEALYKLFDALPPDPGMAFVLIQHLDPKHNSMMAGLLAGHTAMQVLEAEDGMPIQRDRVHIIPPGTYLSIRDGVLRLTNPRERHGARMPFDFFLRSLAADCGARAVCAVLSGTGADGSAGLMAIHDKGGLVIVQDPEDAAHGGMPRSAIMTGAADRVLPVAAIPAALIEHSRKSSRVAHLPPDRAKPAPDDGTNFPMAAIIDLLRTHTAHDFALYKEGTLLRQIERRMAMASIKDIGLYLSTIRDNPDEIDRLAKDMLINVTEFFRDEKTFEILGATIVPELIRRQRLDTPIRIWDAGCSTGEETYSIAMLFLEEIASAKRNVKLQVFASDVDDDALTIARNGQYPESIEKNVSPARLERFFIKEGRSYRVTRELRETVVFTTQDLLADAPFSRLDFVSCRNVLIYLRPEVQEKVLALFHFALREDGILVLGASETVGAFSDRFAPISKRQRIFRHLGRSRPGEVVFPIAPGDGGRTTLPSSRGPEPAALRTKIGDLARQALLDAYAPASVLINARHEGLYYFGPIDRYLKVAVGEASRDLFAMARDGLRTKLRAAIRQAGRPDASAVVGGQVERGGSTVAVSISVQPVPNEGEGFFLVSFSDEPEPKKGGRDELEIIDPPRAVQLEQELDATREELESAIRDLETANDELTATNEEAMSVNEELQSTNEELETSKEELQSLNEELTALNTQLSETIEHQRATANDLRNTMNSSEIAMLFLDGNLEIRLFTPAARTMFSVIASDIGRPLADLARRTNDPHLLADAGAVLGGHVAPNREVEADNGAWYTRRILPYRTHDDQLAGVVVTFTDISERKMAERAIEAARSYSDNIIDTIGQPLVVLDDELCVISAGRSFYNAFSVKPEETVGRQLYAIDDGRLDIAALRDFLGRLRRGERVIEDHQIDVELPPRGMRSLLVNALEIREEPSATRKVLVTIDDITERKRANEALEAAKRMAEQANLGKSRFLAAASHDLRQPLQTLSLLRGILAKRIKDETGSRLVAKLDETLSAMSGMLNTLLDINQLEAGIVRPEIVEFPIGTLLDRLKTEFSYHVTTKQLSWRVVGSSLNVRSDPRLLEQTLRNLLANAVKYTERGKVLLGCRRRGNKLRIQVWDTGIGIPPEQLDSIFEEFHQLDNAARERNRGLGLGLSIVQRISDLLGNAIEVRSWVNRGSVFAAEVPLGENEQLASSAAQRMAAIAGPTGAILIVEDDPTVREMLEILFDGEGHRTTAVAGSNEALALAERGALPSDFVMIADYNLPGDLTGAEVVARLREFQRRDIPAIILTGDISTNTLRKIADAGCVHLSKPAEPETLTRQILDFLAVQRPPKSENARRSASVDSPLPTVFVVDDDRTLRDALQDLLREHGHTVEAYASGEAFLAADRPDREGCLVVDAVMPGMGGIALLEQLKATNHGLPAIMITGHGDVAMAVRAMKAGAADFLEKPIHPDELMASIGRALERAQDSRKLSNWRKTAAERIARLTPREREVMDLVVQGRPNKIIAHDLSVSQRTVENHRAAVMKRTGVSSVPDLIRLVMAAADGLPSETDGIAVASRGAILGPRPTNSPKQQDDQNDQDDEADAAASITEMGRHKT